MALTGGSLIDKRIKTFLVVFCNGNLYFITDDYPVTFDRLDFIQRNDIGTVDAHELRRGEFFFQCLQAEQGHDGVWR